MNKKENSNTSSKSQIEGLAYETPGKPSERVLRLRHAEKIHTSQTERPFHAETAQCPENTTKHIRHIKGYNDNVHIDNLSKNPPQMSDIFRYSRHRMVQEQLVARGITQKEVLYAMQTVPRHLFVSEALHATAYTDRPLPIASGQTISQPYVVAQMCQLLMSKPNMKVLEIGTGSGYQASILHAMGLFVYSVERLPELYHRTRAFLLNELVCQGIQLCLSDGTLGWEQYAPYDRIIVAAGGPSVPDALKEQLKDDGIMLIPVGVERKKQRIVRVFKMQDGYREEDCGPVSFVDLVGSNGWK